MDKQPLTQSTRLWLLDQIARWRQQGLITEDQADAILDLYETPRQDSARRQTVAIHGLIGLAALFVALALLLCIGFNWTFLPAPVKLLVLVGAVGAAHALGFLLRYRWHAKGFSELAFFFGSLLYGGAIALIADIFHLGEHFPDGLWWWALGVMPVALFLDTILVHLLAVSILALWVGTEMLEFRHDDLAFFGLLPRACFTLPIFAGLGLLWSYARKSATTVGLYVPLAAWWFVLLPFVWNLGENPIFFIGSVGALLLILAEVHDEGSRFAVPYRLYGSLLCLGVLSILSFHEMHRDLARIGAVGAFVAQSLAITALSGIVFVAAFVTQTQRGETFHRPIHAFAVRQWLPLSMSILMLGMTLYYAARKGLGGPQDRLATLVPMVLANIGMLVLAFWLMMLGLREDRGLPSAAGMVFFLLWSICRYAEWFGDRGGALGASCMFFACGAAIFTLAMYWHQRKKRQERSSHERELQ